MRYGYNDTVIIYGEQVPFYSRNLPESAFNSRLVVPPTSLYSAVARAWVSFGMINPYRRATVEEVAQYLRSEGLSEKVADWAANVADQHRTKAELKTVLDAIGDR